MQAHANLCRKNGKTIVLVPTMGYFHAGHLALMREGRKRGDELVVSIYVNPMQFCAGEDFETYPRDLERDLELARQEDADTVFMPDNREMYPEGFETRIDLEKLPNHLCGPCRPGHFRGVAVIVAKLFNIVKPHTAVFGAKDFQQLQIIRRMALDLNFDVDIIGHPVVREADELAMSSRNSYMTPEQRAFAPALHQALKKGQVLLDMGVIDADKIIRAASEIIGGRPDVCIDYVAICDPDTLEDMKLIDRPALMAAAVKIGDTRLIDNIMLNP